MTPKELRVGNIVKKGNMEYVADYLTIKMAHNYEPVSLTPEILEKVGFERFKASPPVQGLTWMRNDNSVCFKSSGPKAPYGGFTFQMLVEVSLGTNRVELAYVH